MRDRSVWDAEAVRADLRAYGVAEFGDAAGVVVVDETGFLKQGTPSVGVKRQYSGTAGRIENCPVGVFLGDASAKGRTEAGVPEKMTFHTKPPLALSMLARALDGGVPAAGVTADEVYGGDGALRQALEERPQAYVLAVKRTQAEAAKAKGGPWRRRPRTAQRLRAASCRDAPRRRPPTAARARLVAVATPPSGHHPPLP